MPFLPPNQQRQSTEGLVPDKGLLNGCKWVHAVERRRNADTKVLCAGADESAEGT